MDFSNSQSTDKGFRGLSSTVSQDFRIPPSNPTSLYHGQVNSSMHSSLSQNSQNNTATNHAQGLNMVQNTLNNTPTVYAQGLNMVHNSQNRVASSQDMQNSQNNTANYAQDLNMVQSSQNNTANYAQDLNMVQSSQNNTATHAQDLNMQRSQNNTATQAQDLNMVQSSQNNTATQAQDLNMQNNPNRAFRGTTCGGVHAMRPVVKKNSDKVESSKSQKKGRVRKTPVRKKSVQKTPRKSRRGSKRIMESQIRVAEETQVSQTAGAVEDVRRGMENDVVEDSCSDDEHSGVEKGGAEKKSEEEKRDKNCKNVEVTSQKSSQRTRSRRNGAKQSQEKNDGNQSTNEKQALSQETKKRRNRSSGKQNVMQEQKKGESQSSDKVNVPKEKKKGRNQYSQGNDLREALRQSRIEMEKIQSSMDTPETIHAQKENVENGPKRVTRSKIAKAGLNVVRGREMTDGVDKNQKIRHSTRVVLQESNKLKEQLMEVEIQDICSATIEEKISTGTIPKARWGHTAGILSKTNRMVVYGGDGDDIESILGDVHVYDLEKQKWLLPSNCQSIPRSWHTSISIELGSSHLLLTFGGEGVHKGAVTSLSDVMVLDLEILLWYPPIIRGIPPSPRSGHTCSLLQDFVVVFGGNCGRQWFNSLYTLTIENWQWRSFHVSGVPPSPRTYHTASVINDKLIIFGGNNDKKTFNDVHVLENTSKGWTWFRPCILGKGPCPRTGHTMTVLPNNKLFIYGGWDPTSKTRTVFQDAYILDTTSWVYQVVHLSNDEQDIPLGRVGHTTLCTSIDNSVKLTIFGGQDQNDVRYSTINQITL